MIIIVFKEFNKCIRERQIDTARIRQTVMGISRDGGEMTGYAIPHCTTEWIRTGKCSAPESVKFYTFFGLNFHCLSRNV